MFKGNPHFEQVSDNTILWRYMSFERLQSILDTKSIFFTKVTTYEDDPFEGSYNRVSEESYIQWMLSDLPKENIDNLSNDMQQKIYLNLDNSLSFANKFKELVLVSCWHTNDYESVAMWKLYSNYENGIAIKTTYGRLKKSLENYERPIYGGKLRYIDIRKDKISFGNILAPYAVKRINFSHEKELRLVTQVEHEKHFEYDWSKEKFNNGKLIPCDINLLIDSIFVSPKCSEEFRLEVDQALNKFGLDVAVKKSEISNIY